jgi:hypothetical protein
VLQAVLLEGTPGCRRVRQLGGGKASYWRTAFRLVLDEITELAGLAIDKPERPPVPERYALQAAVMVATVGRGRPSQGACV